MNGITEQFGFKRARRAQARLRLALVAVSGAGKTMGSLRLASGIVQAMIDTGQIEGTLEGKIAMIDTERKSASLYAHVCPFDTLELEPPYSVDRYQQAIAAAEKAGYVICIIDQVSHAWAGPGGQLEYVDALKAQSRNAMSPWAKVTPMQQEFYDRMLRSPMHIIATMRAKTEYVIDEQIVDGRKKQVPRKIGLAPVQRDGIEYEFTACLDIDLEGHAATASKDRTGLFMGRQTRLDEECGRRIAEWLLTGEKADAEAHVEQSTTDAAAAEKHAADLKTFEEGVEDLLLSFTECTTLPDLAAQVQKTETFMKGFRDRLSNEERKPFLDKVIAAKDKRKLELAAPPPPERISAEDVKALEEIVINNALKLPDVLGALGIRALADLAPGQFAWAKSTLESMKKPPARKRAASKEAVV